MNEYRIQRLKEDLTFAQQRNKHQKQQLANYKNVHEKDLKEIERLNNIIKSLTSCLETQINDYKEMGYNQSKIREKDLWMAGQYDEDIFILDKLKELKENK